MPLLDFEEFYSWLCMNEFTTVGRSGTTFCHSPLSTYLRACTGHLYCVDATTYGPASSDINWRLPGWAAHLYAALESSPSPVNLTGGQVFNLLVALFG